VATLALIILIWRAVFNRRR